MKSLTLTTYENLKTDHTPHSHTCKKWNSSGWQSLLEDSVTLHAKLLIFSLPLCYVWPYLFWCFEIMIMTTCFRDFWLLYWLLDSNHNWLYSVILSLRVAVWYWIYFRSLFYYHGKWPKTVMLIHFYLINDISAIHVPYISCIFMQNT